jgi:predicted amidophosphoribosyltransferase
MLQVANAAKHLERLPESGESFHCIMRGNYNGWDLVPAVLRLANPATIETLYIATLGFNRQNAEELLSLVDAGSIRRVRFICSCYYRSVEPAVFDFLHASLTRNGHRAVAIRSHAKILLFEMTNGAAYVIESSANLRSCRNIEQFCMTHDAELLRFHREWMDEVIGHCESKQTPAPAPRTQKIGHSQKRAGIGVFAAHRSEDDRQTVLRWKAAPREHRRKTRRLARELTALIRGWSPALPPDCLVTCPPQGASAPGFYFAAALAARVANMLKVPFALSLARQAPKRYHHPKQAISQKPFTVSLKPLPKFVIVVDDLITSGATMRLSLAAIRAAGSMAFGFAYAGC